MTARLSDIEAHVENVRQLEAVVTATRGIAAGRAQRSRALLAGIESYAQIAARAIGELMRGTPGLRETSNIDGKRVFIVFCAEGGFCGALNDKALDELGDAWKDSVVFEIGSRGATVAEERGIRLDWRTAMANQVGMVPEVAERIARALYSGIGTGKFLRAEVIYPRVQAADNSVVIEKLSLLPLDMSQFKLSGSAVPPLINLPVEELFENLAAEYVYALLVRAAMNAFAAENQARMTAMASARTNIEKTLSELTLREHLARQEAITSEIVELTSSARLAWR